MAEQQSGRVAVEVVWLLFRFRRAFTFFSTFFFPCPLLSVAVGRSVSRAAAMASGRDASAGTASASEPVGPPSVPSPASPRAVHGDPQGPEEALSAAFSLLESLSKRVAALESRCRDAERRADRAEEALGRETSKRARVESGPGEGKGEGAGDAGQGDKAERKTDGGGGPGAAPPAPWQADFATRHEGLALGRPQDHEAPRPVAGGGDTVAAALLRGSGDSGAGGHAPGRGVAFAPAADVAHGHAARGAQVVPAAAGSGTGGSLAALASGLHASSMAAPSRSGSGVNLSHGPLPPPNLPTPSGSFSGLSHAMAPPPLPRESPAGERGLPLPRVPSDARLSRRHEGVPMEATKVVMTQIVTPADSLGSDICAGGAVLSWIDVAAGIAAKSLSRAPVVTASLDEVHFLRPCHVRCVVTLEAVVNRVFRSSMEVGVRVEEEDDDTGTVHHCCSAFLTFVALAPKKNAGGGGAHSHGHGHGSDEAGVAKPRALVPPVYPTDDESAAVHEAALLRREQRLAAKARRAKRAAATGKVERGWAAGGLDDPPQQLHPRAESPTPHGAAVASLSPAAAPHASALHALHAGGDAAPASAPASASAFSPAHAPHPSHLSPNATQCAAENGPSPARALEGASSGEAAEAPSASALASAVGRLKTAPSSGSVTLTPPAVAAHVALARGAFGAARSFSGGSVGMSAPPFADDWEQGREEGAAGAKASSEEMETDQEGAKAVDGEARADAKTAPPNGAPAPGSAAVSGASALPSSASGGALASSCSPGSSGALPSLVRAQVPASATAAHGTQLVLPQHANSIGITFGGTVMRWMEAVAWVSARRVARGAYVLTAALDHLDFAFPTRVGDVVYVEARATAIFGSSVEVLASAWAETPEEGVPRECARCHVTVVSLDHAGVPREIPFELSLDGPGDAARGAEAAERRVQRLRTRALLRAEAAHREARRKSSGRLGLEALV